MEFNRQKFASAFFVLLLLILSSCFDKQFDCSFNFDLCIMNVSNDTVVVIAEKGPSGSPSIKSFSFSDVTLGPTDDTVLKVNYQWEETGGCAASCNDKNYNGDLFVVSFMNGKTLLETRKIVPCKPCDEFSETYNIIKNDELFTDTIYYGQ